MKTAVKISLRGEKRLLKAMYESIVPDNVNIPEGMHIDMKSSNCLMSIKISGDERVKIDTLISTLDEVLEACNMVEKAVGEIKDVRS